MLETADLIWCDPPMVDLIAAAADTYPPEPSSEHNIPTPAGMLVFSMPLPAVWRRHGAEQTDELAALIWATGHDQDDRARLERHRVATLCRP